MTIIWCRSMADMDGMTMPGDWTMSMTWMRMPGQTWLRAGAVFLGMWVMMMVAMMLPALAPVLWRYQQWASRSAHARPARLTILVGLAYFSVWTMVGLAAFLVGITLATLAMQQPVLARAVPSLAGTVVLMAGALQFTRWKAHLLACCRGSSGHGGEFGPANASNAWRYGLQLGSHCCQCCAGLTAILLVGGVMDLRMMAIVTAAISAERLAARGKTVAYAIGIVAVVGGLLLIVRNI
ncbi:DUF2182 domain-containing protein [Silvimonas soli]|uniref:DUF2182 domain-containing protein n=1 Tax=Silvimonas soli TaxID=2980100 RepID=UPI0024B3A8B6|nr:DUF2182 domain-containing protein [Silvimonas soli]